MAATNNAVVAPVVEQSVAAPASVVDQQPASVTIGPTGGDPTPTAASEAAGQVPQQQAESGAAFYIPPPPPDGQLYSPANGPSSTAAQQEQQPPVASGSVLTQHQQPGVSSDPTEPRQGEDSPSSRGQGGQTKQLAAEVPDILGPLMRSEEEEERYHRGINFKQVGIQGGNMLLRLVFAPFVAIHELFLGFNRFFPHQRLPGILMLVGVGIALLQFILFATIKPHADVIPVGLEAVYFILNAIYFLIMTFVVMKILHQHTHLASSLIVRDAATIYNSWGWTIVSFLRIALEGAQIGLIPLLFVPLDDARGPKPGFSAWVDYSGSRYTVINGILLRSFGALPSNADNRFTALNTSSTTTANVAFPTEGPIAFNDDAQYTGTEYIGNGYGTAGSEQTFYVLIWPAIILGYWCVSIAQSTSMKSHMLGEVVNQWQIAPWKCYHNDFLKYPTPQLSDRDLLPPAFYQGFLHLQHELISLEGPLSTMLLLFGGQFLTDWYNRVPEDFDLAQTDAELRVVIYQGLGVLAAMSVFGFYYLLPALMMDEICDQRRVEVPLFRVIRGVMKTVVILSTCIIAGAGENTAESMSTRSVCISVLFLVFHVARCLLVIVFRPSPLRSLNSMLLIANVFGIFMAITAMVLVGQSGNITAAGMGGAILLILFGLGAIGVVIAMLARFSARSRALPTYVAPGSAPPTERRTMGPAHHPDSEIRYAVVSGLRLYSSDAIVSHGGDGTVGGGNDVVQGGFRHLIPQIFWRPMEPFHLMCASETPDGKKFILQLLTHSRLPGNVRGHPSWMLNLLLGIRGLVPQMGNTLVLDIYHLLTAERFLGNMGPGSAYSDVHIQVVRSLTLTSALMSTTLDPSVWIGFYVYHCKSSFFHLYGLSEARAAAGLAGFDQYGNNNNTKTTNSGGGGGGLGSRTSSSAVVGSGGAAGGVWSESNAANGGLPTLGDGAVGAGLGINISSNIGGSGNRFGRAHGTFGGPDGGVTGEGAFSAVEHLVDRVIALSGGLGTSGVADRSAVALMEACAALAATLRMQVTAYCQLIYVLHARRFSQYEQGVLISLVSGPGGRRPHFHGIIYQIADNAEELTRAAESLALLSRTVTQYWVAKTPESTSAQTSIRKAWSSVGRDLLNLRASLHEIGVERDVPFMNTLSQFPDPALYPNSAALVRELEILHEDELAEAERKAALDFEEAPPPMEV